MKKDFEIDTNPQNMLEEKENIHKGAPRKEEEQRINNFVKVGFTKSEIEAIKAESQKMGFSTITNYLRFKILNS